MPPDAKQPRPSWLAERQVAKALPTDVPFRGVTRPRRRLTLPAKERACMSCGRDFRSEGAQHRLCKVCRREP